MMCSVNTASRSGLSPARGDSAAKMESQVPKWNPSNTRPPLSPLLGSE